MPPRLSQQEWKRRFAAVDAVLLGEVKNRKLRVPARCLDCGTEWDALPSSIAQGARGCPDCSVRARSSKRRLDPGVLASRAADANLRWCEPVRNTTVPVLTECLACGYVWKFRPANVKKRGCPKCSGQVVTQKDWEQRFAQCGLELLEPVKAAKSKALARCRACEHEWKASPGHVRAGRGGCPKCGIKRRGELRRIAPQEVAEREHLAKVRWLAPVELASVEVPAECQVCGHVWPYAPARVGKSGPRSGCPNCAGKVVTSEEWDARANESGYRLMENVKSSKTLVEAECLSCGRVAPVWPDTLGRSGCAACSHTGFDPIGPDYLYLIVKADGTAKVGITGVGRVYEERMRKHTVRGYRHVRRWRLEPGSVAADVERETVSRWRKQDGLPPAAPFGEDGFTETVNTALLPLPVIVERIDDLVAARTTK